MSKQVINIGTSELSGDGESIRAAFDKVNENFTELYTDNETFISLATLKTEVAASTNFEDFQARILAL